MRNPSHVNGRRILAFIHIENGPIGIDKGQNQRAAKARFFMRAELDEASVAKANAQFWEQMLDMRLELVPDSEVFCMGAGHLMGSVSLSGTWKGRIEVRLRQNQSWCALSRFVEGRCSLLVASTQRLRLRSTATLVLR